MQLNILGIILAFFISVTAFSATVTDKLPAALKIGLDILSIDGPEGLRDNFNSYRLSWITPVWGRLRINTGFSYLPDSDHGSANLNISHDWWSLFGLLEYSYPYLMRWHVNIGPTYLNEAVRYHLTTEPANQADRFFYTDIGVIASIGADYAFNDAMELGFDGGIQRRLRDKQTDYFYGLTLGWNINFFWRK